MVLSSAMILSMISNPKSVDARSGGGGQTDPVYSFGSDSFTAAEGGEEMKIEITRGGDLSRPAEAVLLSYDMSADYETDYTLSCDGDVLQKKEKVSNMYTAYRDKRVLSDYEADNRAFADAILSYSKDDRKDIGPVANGKEDKDAVSGAVKEKKVLADADEEGINYYNSLSVMDAVGARAAETVLRFAAGEKTKEITVSVEADHAVEYDETFVLAVVSGQVSTALKQHVNGTPDIPLKEGRDVVLAAVDIQDDSDGKPVCAVNVEQAEYVRSGEEKTQVAFTRRGALATYSTVVLSKEGKACGYFDFVPYQEVQTVELEPGRYDISAYRDCILSGSRSVTVKEENGQSPTAAVQKKLSSAGTHNKRSTINFSDSEKKTQMGWFPDWAKKSGTVETADYIAVAGVGVDNMKFRWSSWGGYGASAYMKDKNKSHNGVNVYNTNRLDTSGFLSSTQNSWSQIITGYDSDYANGDYYSGHYRSTDYYDMTGIESVETRYYVDDTELNLTLGVSDLQKNKHWVTEKGIQDIKVDISPDLKSRSVYIQNDNGGGGHDGADVYVINAFKMNKRTYQMQVTDSNKLDYVTKSGDKDSVAARSVSADKYTLMKMGANSKVAINTEVYESYPMVQAGYQFLDENGQVIKDSYVNTDSTQFTFDKDFLKKHQGHSFQAKRSGSDKSYYTFSIQPVMKKIALRKFDIVNNSPESATSYNPYKGKLALDNASTELYQGDWVSLSAKDVQEGYTFTGAYVKYKKADDTHWHYNTIGVDTDKKVHFRLEAGYSDYEIEPVFSGHEADTVTVTYAENAAENGTIMMSGNETSSYTAVTSEEYQINTRVALNAKPKDGYLTCWHSGSRTYYGDVLYYMMDGNSDHNTIVVDFVKKSSVTTARSNYTVSLLENEVNLRTGSAYAKEDPLADANIVVTTGQRYEAETDENGKALLSGFEAVVGGVYSMMVYREGENRYRYMEFKFDGKDSTVVSMPKFEGLAAYPDQLTARVDGIPSNQEYVDLTDSGILEVKLKVYRPDVTTKLGEVEFLFQYEDKDGMKKKNYTVEKPDSGGDSASALGAYSTYTLQVAAPEIPDMSYLFVNVKSSYDVKQSGEGGTPGVITIDNETGFVNSGYKFKTPSESDELLIQEEVPELPGLVSAGEDIEIPYIGKMDFGFSAKNGAFFSKQVDINTGTVYLLGGYNVASTWAKTFTDRWEGASRTRDALKQAEEDSRAVGDTSGCSSDIVSLGKKPVANVAPAVCMKLALRSEDSATRIVGADIVLGLDELLMVNVPFSLYGVPLYVNLAFNGEEFYEVHAEGDRFSENGVESAIMKPLIDGANMGYYFQVPNLDITVKTGVGYNAFLGVYANMGGNLKMDIEYENGWRAGGYFYIKGGVGADLAVFTADITINIPGDGGLAFGSSTARNNIHSASTTVKSKGSASSSVTRAGTETVLETLDEKADELDENPVFTVRRNKSKDPALKAVAETSGENTLVKSVDKNAEVKLLKLSGGKMMAMTLVDNGAGDDSLNFLSAAYAISEDGGKTWKNKNYVNKSDSLQWNVEYHKLRDKILVTWSDGDLDRAVGSLVTDMNKISLPTVAAAMQAFDLKGRYFDMDGNAMGPAFTIAADDNAALSVLDATEDENGEVNVYYESRAYDTGASTLTEFVSQDQKIHRAVLSADGVSTLAGEYVLGKEDGSGNARVMETEAFSYNGIDGEVVVVDRDGKLMRQAEDGEEEPSIDDRQIYIHVRSDRRGIIPKDTLIPVTDTETCAQHIVLEEDEKHIYLFWNQNGTIRSLCDFLPQTAKEYEEWTGCAGNMGGGIIADGGNTMTLDTKFKVALNENGKGVVLWKNVSNNYEAGSEVTGKIYATVCEVVESKQAGSTHAVVNGKGRGVALPNPDGNIQSMDVQVLENGNILFGYSLLNGDSVLDSSASDVKVETMEEAEDLKIEKVNGKAYPQAGEEYTSDILIRNTGLVDAENITVSASGALEGSATLSELTQTEEETGVQSGEEQKIHLPVKAAKDISDGDKVTYRISRGDEVLETYEDSVKVGAYMVPEEMASVISIPGTKDYLVTTRVINKGNREGTTDLVYYNYTQGTQLSGSGSSKENRVYENSDKTVLQPGESASLTYRMENAAYTGTGLRMISVQTGDGYDQAVEGELPRMAAAPVDENTGNPPTAEPAPTQTVSPKATGAPVIIGPPKADPTAAATVAAASEPPKAEEKDTKTIKKGDVVTAGSGQQKAKYKVISKSTVTYHKSLVSSKADSAKVPDSVKISGKTYKVTEISTKAWKGCKKLKKVVLGKNVMQIQKKAFYGCAKLKTIQFNTKKLEKIGDSAFQGCKKLKKLTIKSKKLKKKKVKNSLKGSSVGTIQTTKSLRKSYKKYFAKKNSGRKVKIK